MTGRESGAARDHLAWSDAAAPGVAGAGGRRLYHRPVCGGLGPAARAVPAGHMVRGLVGAPRADKRAAALGPVCAGRLPGVSRAGALHPGATAGPAPGPATTCAVRGGASSAGMDQQGGRPAAVATARRSRRDPVAGGAQLWAAVYQVLGRRQNPRAARRDGRRAHYRSTRGLAR
jgi:hypothetical protein